MTCNRYFKQTAHAHIHHTQRKQQYNNTGCVKRWVLCYLFTRHSCPTKTWPHTAATQQHLWLLPDTGQHLFTLLALSTDMQKMLVLPMNIVFHDRLVGAFSFHFSFGRSAFKPQKSSCTAYCVFCQKVTQKMWKWEKNQKPPTGNTTSVHRRPSGGWREGEEPAQSGSLKTAWQVQPWSSGLSIEIARPRARMASGTEWCGLWQERGCHWPSMVGLWLSVDTAGSDRGAEAGRRVCSSPLSPR